MKPTPNSTHAHDDLQTCVRQIRERTGIVARSMVWAIRRGKPAGAPDLDVARDGHPVQSRCRPEYAGRAADRLRRILMMYDVDIGGFERSMREPASNRGDVDVPERIVQVDLDQAYDPTPRGRKRISARSNASTGCSRNRCTCRRMRIRKAPAWPNPCISRTGTCRCAPTFPRAAWQLNTRANVQVYAWMPCARVPAGRQAARARSAVSAYGGAPARARTARARSGLALVRSGMRG